jgi:hypothetical protein
VTESPDNKTQALVHWDAFIRDDQESPVALVHLQWSDNLEFLEATTGSDKVKMSNDDLRSKSGTATLRLDDRFDTLQSTVLYVRIRTLGVDGKPGEWSTPNERWKVTKDCSDSSYLNVSTAENGARLSLSPLNWTCDDCPVGASCLGDISWDGVVAIFGFWRVPGLPPNEFVKCPFPGACLGAPNPKLVGRYLNQTKDGFDGLDYAEHKLPEGCNLYYGFENSSTLCHACADKYKRMGLNRCSDCPEEGQNYGLLALAVVLLIIGGTGVVYMTIKDAGEADQSEVIRKITFNFLQVSAMAAGFPLHWPPELEGLFDFQGAISTAGEHILNPDCSVRGISAADLFYAKQIGYALTPPVLALIIYSFWKGYSVVTKKAWRARPRADTHTPKDKMVVTICVLLYFFWPTSLKQTFRMFSCRPIGTNDVDRMYLMADVSIRRTSGKSCVSPLTDHL